MTPKRVKQEDKMTERIVMRCTPEQLALLKEVSPDPSSGGVSSIWRFYILYLAQSMKQYKDGKIDNEDLQAFIQNYAEQLARDIRFQFLQENVEKEIESYRSKTNKDDDIPY